VDLFLKRQCSRNLVVECVEEAVDNITLCTAVYSCVYSCAQLCVQLCTVVCTQLCTVVYSSCNVVDGSFFKSVRGAPAMVRSYCRSRAALWGLGHYNPYRSQRSSHSERYGLWSRRTWASEKNSRQPPTCGGRSEAPIGARGSTCRPLCTPDLRADAAARFLERRAGIDRNA